MAINGREYEVTFEFNSLWKLDPLSQADTDLKNAQRDQIDVTIGKVNPAELRQLDERYTGLEPYEMDRLNMDEPRLPGDDEKTDNKFDVNPYHDKYGRFAKGRGVKERNFKIKKKEYNDMIGTNYPDMKNIDKTDMGKAVDYYTHLGSIEMTGYMQSHDNFEGSKGEEIKKNIDLIDKYIDKFPMRTDQILYRGIRARSDQKLKEQLKNIKTGDIMDYKGFQSFSTNFDTALGHVKYSSGSVMLAISAKRGSRIAPVGNAREGGSDETEFIAARNLKYKIIGKTKTKGQTVLIGEMI